MRQFIAIHTHEYGTTVHLFTSEVDAARIFNHLHTDDSETDDPGTLTQVDFANRINIDFEPDKEESLEVQEFNPDEFTPVDLSDFVGLTRAVDL